MPTRPFAQPPAILIVWRTRAWLNRLRALRHIGWRHLPIALITLILATYGVFWLQSLAADLARLPAPFITRAIAAACTGIGLLTGLTGMTHDRAAIATPFLAIQPWSASDRRKALLASLAARLATGMILTALALLLAAATKILSPAIGASFYGAGFGAGCLPRPTHATQSEPAPRRTTIHLARFDHPAPRWAGWWALAPRVSSAAWLSLTALIASLSIATAASTGSHPVTLAPGIAVIGAFLTMTLTLRCAPLASPVLRTTAIPYSRACLAMIRLPALLAFIWFALFITLATILGLITPHLVIKAGAIALLLSLGYALAAMSIPTSSRLAFTAYIIALALAADEYAQAQNMAFVILFAVLAFLIGLARARFRGRR